MTSVYERMTGMSLADSMNIDLTTACRYSSITPLTSTHPDQSAWFKMLTDSEYKDDGSNVKPESRYVSIDYLRVERERWNRYIDVPYSELPITNLHVSMTTYNRFNNLHQGYFDVHLSSYMLPYEAPLIYDSTIRHIRWIPMFLACMDIAMKIASTLSSVPWKIFKSLSEVALLSATTPSVLFIQSPRISEIISANRDLQALMIVLFCNDVGFDHSLLAVFGSLLASTDLFNDTVVIRDFTSKYGVNSLFNMRKLPESVDGDDRQEFNKAIDMIVKNSRRVNILKQVIVQNIRSRRFNISEIKPKSMVVQGSASAYTKAFYCYSPYPTCGRIDDEDTIDHGIIAKGMIVDNIMRGVLGKDAIVRTFESRIVRRIEAQLEIVQRYDEEVTNEEELKDDKESSEDNEYEGLRELMG